MKTIIARTGFRHPALILVAGLSFTVFLSGCQTTAGSRGLNGETSAKIDAALERAAGDAAEQGGEESLAMLERMYKRDSGNAETALKYARALREAGRLNRASAVLSPLAEKKSSPTAVHTEYASIMAAMGDYKAAESHARMAVTADPESARAYHVLGTALDAQGFHPQAEVAFRKSLELWPQDEDPTAILNNLGLNLASQGFIDEAIDTLRKAAAISPGRTEIERNLRIVTALQIQPPVTGTRLVPMPKRKPGQTDDNAGI